VTEKLADEILSLPMYPELTGGQQEEIVDGIRTFLGA
jgi:dTDP-4-amino-4,6-dideoxygalactose transaminase